MKLWPRWSGDHSVTMTLVENHWMEFLRTTSIVSGRSTALRILKGALLGTVIFSLATGVYFFKLLHVKGPVPAGYSSFGEISIEVIKSLTIANPLFWSAFAASLVIGYAIAGYWPRASTRAPS